MSSQWQHANAKVKQIKYEKKNHRLYLYWDFFRRRKAKKKKSNVAPFDFRFLNENLFRYVHNYNQSDFITLAVGISVHIRCIHYFQSKHIVRAPSPLDHRQ